MCCARKRRFLKAKLPKCCAGILENLQVSCGFRLCLMRQFCSSKTASHPQSELFFRENKAQNPRKADALGGFLMPLSRKRAALRAALPCGAHPFGRLFQFGIRNAELTRRTPALREMIAREGKRRGRGQHRSGQTAFRLCRLVRLLSRRGCPVWQPVQLAVNTH